MKMNEVHQFDEKKQMKHRKIQRSDVLLYIVFTLIVNYLVATAVSLLMQWFISPLELNRGVTYFLLCFACFAGTLALFYRLYGEKIFSYYQPNADKKYLVKAALSLILPGEVIRFLLSLISLGASASTGVFSITTTILFEATYLKWTGRYATVRQGGAIIPLDVLTYVSCYLIQFAVYFLVVLGIYRYLWNAREKERKNFGIQESQ